MSPVHRRRFRDRQAHRRSGARNRRPQGSPRDSRLSPGPRPRERRSSRFPAPRGSTRRNVAAAVQPTDSELAEIQKPCRRPRGTGTTSHQLCQFDFQTNAASVAPSAGSSNSGGRHVRTGTRHLAAPARRSTAARTDRRAQPVAHPRAQQLRRVRRLPGHHDRQRGLRDDQPQFRHHREQAGVGPQRLQPGLRGDPRPRRPSRGPLRPQEDLPDRSRRVRPHEHTGRAGSPPRPVCSSPAGRFRRRSRPLSSPRRWPWSCRSSPEPGGMSRSVPGGPWVRPLRPAGRRSAHSSRSTRPGAGFSWSTCRSARS
ncbi:hypothetical protein M2271_008175 [Streptomyces sp. LBL]|nr:hypothetical protein [Streptomyces sp. LBL]